MPNLQNHMRWYSNQFFKPGVKRKKSPQENSPFKLESVGYLFTIVDNKRETENTAERLKTTLSDNRMEIFDFPESIDNINYRMIWIRTLLVLDKRDISMLYPGRVSYDPKMYYAYKDGKEAGLRNYVLKDILKISPKPKKNPRFFFF